jgi:hypothetical protein
MSGLRKDQSKIPRCIIVHLRFYSFEGDAARKRLLWGGFCLTMGDRV